MRILVVGNPEIILEFNAKIAGSHHISYATHDTSGQVNLRNIDVVFDLDFDESSENLELYNEYGHLALFLNIPKTSLTETVYYYKEIRPTLFGINALPTMLKRDVLEVSLLRETDAAKLEKICHGLGAAYLVVEDRVGMVTPRVACMIINEAYFTVQEGTASKEDIDQAMKLGTNYPFGPFEWCRKMGIQHVYEVLEAIYEDTTDERYKICPLLKKEYMRA